MIAQDCARYLREQKEEPCRAERQAVLLKLWHMFAELEQMHFLIRTKSVRPEEQKRLLHMIEAIQEELYPVISGENLPVIRRELQYQDPEVVYVLDQYLRHAESLLAYQSCIPF